MNTSISLRAVGILKEGRTERWAEIIGVHPSTVRRWKTGVHNIPDWAQDIIFEDRKPKFTKPSLPEYSDLKRHIEKREYTDHTSRVKGALTWPFPIKETIKKEIGKSFGPTYGKWPHVSLHRRFVLFRNKDVSGVSGLGLVAEGVQFANGTCVINWKTKHTSTAVYRNLENVIAVHGHDGATEVKFIDTLAD